MKSTRRKRPTKKSIETPIIEVSPETPIEIETPTRLHADHLRQLEIGQRDVDNARLLMATEEQALRNLLLEHELIRHKIEKQRILVATQSQSYETTKKSFERLKAEIWPLYGFERNEGLGYNPETGEIKR